MCSTLVCLDTDFMIDVIRREGKAEMKLEGLLESGESLTTTPISVSELFKGAYRSKRREEQIKNIKAMLRYIKILEFSVSSCELYGKLVNELRKKGTPIGDLDAIIAGIAITHGESLLTKDEHFKRIPSLIIESW